VRTQNSFLVEFIRILKSVIQSLVLLAQIYCLVGFKMILKILFLIHYLVIINIMTVFQLFQVLILLDEEHSILILSFFEFILQDPIQFKHLLCLLYLKQQVNFFLLIFAYVLHLKLFFFFLHHLYAFFLVFKV